MADLSERVKEIKKLIDSGEYLTINRTRQYGKTTTLTELRKFLKSEYEIVSLDFQGLGNASFRTEESFCRGFIRLLVWIYCNSLVYSLGKKNTLKLSCPVAWILRIRNG